MFGFFAMRVQLPDTCSQNQLFTSKPMYRYIECQQMLSHSRVYPLNRGKIVPYFWQEVKSIASCFVQTYFVKVVSIRYLLFWAWWKVKQFWMLTVSMSVNHQPAGKMQSVLMDWLENFTIEFVLDFHNTSSVYPMKPINLEHQPSALINGEYCHYMLTITLSMSLTYSSG